MMRFVIGMLLVVAAIAASGCSRQKGLHDLRHTGNGPDEFGIIPANPLTAPEDYTALPAPTPGGTNLTDRNPNEEAIVALGGRAPSATGVPSSDAAIVQASSRYGVAPDTRASIQAEDDKFRKVQGRWTRIKLFPVDRYGQIYRKEKLDPFQTADQFRKAGATTPSAPPGTKQKN